MRFSNYSMVFFQFAKTVHGAAVLTPDVKDECSAHPEAPMRQKMYQQAFEACGIPNEELVEFRSCVDGVFHLSGIGEVIVDKTNSIERRSMRFVYETNHPSIIVSVHKNRQCEQHAIFESLGGLGDGLTPRIFGIDTLEKKECLDHIFFMERRPDESIWPLHKSVREIALNLASLVHKLKILYSLGFLYGSIGSSILRILGDETILTEWGSAELSPGKTSDFSFLKYVIPMGDIRDAFIESLDYLNFMPCPPFDFWSNTFQKLTVHSELEMLGEIRKFYTPLLDKKEKKTVNKMIRSQQVLESLLLFPSILRPSVPPAFTLSDLNLSLLHPNFREIIQNQLDNDSVDTTSRPYLLYDSEVIDGKIFKIGRVISRRKDAVLALTSDPSGYVLKYQSNCGDLNKQTLALQRDFGFLKYVQDNIPDMRVAVRVLHLSPPIKLPIWRSLKTDFKMEKLGADAYENCAKNPRSHLRYMLMEKAKDSVFDIMDSVYFNRFERLKLGLQLAKELVFKLKKIHDLGMVHGDVHPGNVVRLENPADGTFEFVFIDFGLAFFNDEFSPNACHPNKCETVVEASRHNHCYQTFWNLEGSRIGYRDDVLNALMVAFMLMNGNPAYDYCYGLRTDTPKMIEWKKNSFVFSMRRRDVVAEATPGVDESVRRAIRKLMKNALNEARSVADVSDRPNYDSIVASLSEALRIVSGSAVDFSTVSSTRGPVLGIADWSEAKKFAQDLEPGINVPLACPVMAPYQVELVGRGKVTFPLTCDKANPCDSISPLNAYKYVEISAKERRLISDFPILRFNHFSPIDDNPCFLYYPKDIVGVLTRQFRFSQVELAAVLIAMIRLLEKIHELGIVTSEISPKTFCWVLGKISTIEFCDLSRLRRFVDVNTKELYSDRSRADDMEELFTFALKSLKIKNEDRTEIDEILTSFLDYARDMTDMDVPLYDTWAGELEWLADQYVEEPEDVEVPVVTNFIDLKRVDGSIVWKIAASILAESQSPGPIIDSDHPEICPIEGTYDFDGLKITFPPGCYDQAECISDDGYIKATRVMKKPDPKFDHLDLSFAFELRSAGIPTYQFYSPSHSAAECYYSPRYERAGGVEVKLVPQLTTDIVKKSLIILKKIHSFGLVYRGNFDEGFMLVTNSEIAIKNKLRSLGLIHRGIFGKGLTLVNDSEITIKNLRYINPFVDPLLGVHLSPVEHGSRKEDLIQFARQIRAIADKNSQTNFVNFFDSLIESTMEIEEEAKPDYDFWINLIPDESN